MAEEDPGDKAEMSTERRERIASDPYCATLGIELADFGQKRATTRLTVTEELLNFHGTVHGGAVYSLADAAFAAASNAGGQTALALEANISYLESVETETTLTAVAEETHRSHHTAAYEVTVTDEASAKVATFRGRVYLP